MLCLCVEAIVSHGHFYLEDVFMTIKLLGGFSALLLVTSFAYANDETIKHDINYARQKEAIAKAMAKQKAAEQAALNAAIRDKKLDALVKSVPSSPSSKPASTPKPTSTPKATASSKPSGGKSK